MREASILEAVRAQDWTVAELAEHLYHKVDFRLKMAAQRNVLAHLLKLEHEGIVKQAGDAAMEVPDDYVPDDLPPADEKFVSKREIEILRRDAERRFVLVG